MSKEKYHRSTKMEKLSKLHELPQSVRDKGAKLAYRNALRHVKAARLLAHHGEYGNGISHLVLGIEEATKSLLLFGYRFAPQIQIQHPEKVLQEIFRKHESKQVPFAVIVLMMQFTKKVITLLDKGEKEFIKELPKWSDSQIKSDRSTLGKIARVLRQINKFKNDGFYVDFRNGSWVDPKKKTKKDFVRLEKIVAPYIEAFAAIFSMNEKEIEEHKKMLEKAFAGTSGNNEGQR